MEEKTNIKRAGEMLQILWKIEAAIEDNDVKELKKLFKIFEKYVKEAINNYRKPRTNICKRIK